MTNESGIVTFPDDLTVFDEETPVSPGEYAKVHCDKLHEAFWVKVTGYPDEQGHIPAELANDLVSGIKHGSPLSILASNVKGTMSEFELQRSQP